MKSLKFTFGLLALALCAISTSASAQVTVSGGADLVSTYVWRGSRLGGASVQPYAEVAYEGFAVGAWGSTGLITFADEKEVDFYASYSIGNFSAMVTNYFCGSEMLTYYGNAHVYEASVAYTISEDIPLSIGLNYNFYGDDDNSAYISLDYPVTVGEVDLGFGVGITPAAGAYADDFNVCSVSATASRSVAISDSFELPMFVSVITNPAAETAYLLFGTSLTF